MEFPIYLEIEGNVLTYNIMKPEDTLDYKFTARQVIDEESTIDQDKLISLNKIQAIICHLRLMDLRLQIDRYKSPGLKLKKLEKYYIEVLSAYLDFFEELPFQLPQIQLNSEKKYAIDYSTGEMIPLSKKQFIFVKLFHKMFGFGL